MRTIAHISDLHFGKTNPLLPAALRQALLAVHPDVVVVSGDLTQRARSREFDAARIFLSSLPFPKIVVPGNHDVPLHNVLARWLTPLDKYRRYIGDEVEPYYGDAEIAIQGLNTARSATIKNGRINPTQVERACQRLSSGSPDLTRILVTHHPFDLPADKNGALVGRAEMALSAFTKSHIDIILSGHFHVGHAGSSARRYSSAGRATVLIHAGTATSSRERGEGNSWNVIRISRPNVVVERHAWADERFVVAGEEIFELGSAGWFSSSNPPNPLRP